MRAWRRIFISVAAFVIVIFAAANLILQWRTPENGRPYRVEINRVAQQIEQNGYENMDLSQCHYVYNVVEYGDDFYNCESDYAVREIGGRLYRFDYSTAHGIQNTPLIVLVNVVLAAMAALVFGILLYVRSKILYPFEQMSNVPYELSKGNLAMPVRENKNRFFGKFMWGIDLLRENMEQQKQRELELHREKKTLLLSLSHDLKTPLSAIKLYAQALSANLYSDPERQRAIAGSINEKADEIEGYVCRIMTAAREDFLSLEVENSEFYLSELIQNIEAYYREKLSLVKTEFVVGGYRDCLLFGDRNRSMEVLQNVIENALKYGDGACVEILFPEEESGVLVAVRNGGCTLAGADLPHIFESFWRGTNARGVRGSGLGLYICRQLMHKMNGEIFAEIDGGGITVTTVFERV